MSKIKTWNERCEEHPDHQTGMVSNSMIQARMQEEIDELRAALAEPETCTWQQDCDSDSGVYGTSCGSYFSINDGTPEDNKMAWCCYCGRKLTQALITEDSDE